jgi:ABC-type antimicrobial peptide transport system permease subunit
VPFTSARLAKPQNYSERPPNNSNPIGRRLGHDQKSSDEVEIVGVVGDTKYDDLDRETPATIFVPRLQNLETKDYDGMTFAVRTTGNPNDLIPAVRHAVQSLDQNVPVSYIRTQVEQIDLTLFQERLFAKLSSFFGLLALTLACIGLYGIMSYAVARRTNEIGIRMALGARQEDILRKVLREAFVLVLVGIAVGIPIALGALRVISSMLFGLKPTDPVTLAAAILHPCWRSRPSQATCRQDERLASIRWWPCATNDSWC